jgi:sialate O-acetylesterase
MRLASLFSDHMVLQQGMVLPVWGWSEPGDEVTVRFRPGAGSANAEQRATARAGGDGRWTVRLNPLKSCAVPARLEAVSGGSGRTAVAADALVGEVWLASGQSNMYWMVKDSNDAVAEMAAADWPAVRMFTVPNAVREKPLADAGGVWAVSSPAAVGDFSAVAYFFGRELHRREGFPVGLINSSWGGTRVEAWTSRAALVEDELCREDVRGYETLLRSEERHREFARHQADPEAWLRSHVAQDPGNEGLGRGWAGADCDDSAWPEMDLPRPWQRGGVPGNGVVWFRRTVEVPAELAGRDLVLRLGACDKHDFTYFNGVQVGATGWETQQPWTVQRIYRVPGRLVRAGRNAIAVRVYSYRNIGGMTGPAHEMRLEPPAGGSGAAVALAGPWRHRVEHNFGVILGTAGEPTPIPNQNSPYVLFDNMIEPLVPYAMRGVIWYQGESNTQSPENARLYRTRFPRLIRDWRRVWGGQDFPFLFVQLANYLPITPSGQPSGWPELREAQLMALAEPKTAMAVTIDIGDPGDVHPKNKQEVGRRLALPALSRAYGRTVVYSGPLYRSHTVEGSSVRVQFDHVGGGLVARGGEEIRGFAVAGQDGGFEAAQAVIDGASVVVRAAGVEAPLAVRYAWADNPDCNLCNREGLPASPFRTDDW